MSLLFALLAVLLFMRNLFDPKPRDHVEDVLAMVGERAELIELPVAFGEIQYQRPSGQWGRIEGYTRNQMREAVAAAVAKTEAKQAQQVAVPAWVPMTEKLLNSQESWLYQPIWIAGPFGVEQATYEWRQGRYPHCFDTPDGDCRDLSEITHAMPVTTPTHPQGAKP